jgi:hypothetical protein
MGKNDVVTGFVLFVFGVAVFIGSMSYQWGSLQEPGPGFLPRLASAILILLALFIIGGSLMKRGKISAQNFFPTRDAPTRVAIAVGAFFAFRLLFPILGLAPTTFLFFLLITRLLGHHSWGTSFIFSLLTTALSYLLFQVWLDIPMPKSFLGL